MNKWVDIVKKNKADIFMVVGIGSILFGGALAIKNTPKACKVLEENEDSSKTEKVKKVAPLYIMKKKILIHIKIENLITIPKLLSILLVQNLKKI